MRRVEMVTASTVSLEPVAGVAPRGERILATLAEAGGGRIGFQALRRSLGLHPQALARTLRSLQSEGLVAKDAMGYRLVRPAPRNPELPSIASQPVFAAFLPPFVEPRTLVDRLERRWFQGLRWYGVLESGPETTLVWTTEDQSAHVRVRFADRLVGIEVQPLKPGVEAFAHVAPLLGALAAYYADAAKAAVAVPRAAA